jgi:hypothetical protein
LFTFELSKFKFELVEVLSCVSLSDSLVVVDGFGSEMETGLADAGALEVGAVFEVFGEALKVVVSKVKDEHVKLVKRRDVT